MEQKTDRDLLEIANGTPLDFPGALLTSLEEGQNIPAEQLFAVIGQWIQKIQQESSSDKLARLVEGIRRHKGLQTAVNVLSYLEVVLEDRKPSIGMYDHAFHFIGGAQKYGCTIASALQEEFDITLISNKNIRKQDLQKWYDLDLSKCKLKTVPIPFFEDKEENTSYIEPGVVDLKKDNPFHIMSRESGTYDVFINNSMVEMVYPLSVVSLFVCHFPEREISRFFYVDKYSEIIHNSLYTAEWIKKKWHLTPHKHIYPPVDMEPGTLPRNKENIILSASRFDPGGNKQQAEIIKTFVKLMRLHPELEKEWKLVVVGGSADENPYLKKIRKLVSRYDSFDIEIKVNIPADELRALYERSKIFWHLTGLNQEDPAKVEHFGMTIAESMQNGVVPFVFNGGGQKEIVQEGQTGYLVESAEELMGKTYALMKDIDLLQRLSQNAFQSSKRFNKDSFIKAVWDYFESLMTKYFPRFGENQK